MRTLVLTSLGGALELFDFVVFVFFVPALTKLFFPESGAPGLAEIQTLTVFGVGYLARPLGGVLIAHFGDRLGRKRTFAFCVSLMALSTFGIAILPTYAQVGILAPILLSLLRLLQGVAVGGEVAGGYLFASEHVIRRRQGIACGIVASGTTVGVLGGVLLSLALHMGLSQGEIESWGWRVPFAVGGCLGLFALLMRLSLRETPVFQALAQAGRLSTGLPLALVLRRHGRAVWTGTVAFWVFGAHFLMLLLLGPTLMQTLFHISAVEALTAGCLIAAGAMLACPVSGLLFDALGERRALVLVCLAAFGADAAFFLAAPGAPALVLPLAALAGIGSGLTCGATVVLVRAFPPEVAYSGVALALNLAAGIGAGLTPIAIAALVPILPSAPLWYLGVICLSGAWLAARLPSSRSPTREGPP